MASRWAACLVMVVLAAGGCKLPVTTAGAKPGAGAAPASDSLLRLTGRLEAPPSLISNGGGSIIGDHGAGLISNNGGGLGAGRAYATLAVEAWKPVAGAEVTLVDAKGLALPGLAAVRSGADGRFVITGAPSGQTVVVRATAGSLRLQAAARPGVAEALVDPATTVVTARLITTGRLEDVGATGLEAWLKPVREVLQRGDVPLDLSTDAAIERLYEKVQAAAPEVAALEAGATTAGPSPSPAPASPSPSPSSSPSRSPSSSPSPTPRPAATPKATDLDKLTSTKRCVYCTLPDAQLAGADLAGADLTYAKLGGADLKGANLAGANLTYADLKGADLTDADLTGATLTYADLSGATIAGAKLVKASMVYTKATGLDLAEADLTGTDTSKVRR